MRRFTTLFVAFLLLAPILLPATSVGSAQSAAPVGMAVIDVTATSDCSISHREHESIKPDSPVILEYALECPAGSVLYSTPVGSEAEALRLGGIFVPLTGNNEADFMAIENAKARLYPVNTYSGESASMSACSDRGFSRSMSYTAYDPGVTVSTTVYYYQEYSCASGLSGAQAKLSWNADVYWRFAEYAAPGQFYNNSHGCTNLSTGWTYDTYNISRPLGYRYKDESTNFAPCWTASGQSYSNIVYLNPS